MRLLQQPGATRVPSGWHHRDLQKPLTSVPNRRDASARDLFPEEDAYRCPAESDCRIAIQTKKPARCGATDQCLSKLLAQIQCTTGPERRITRWEHEH